MAKQTDQGTRRHAFRDAKRVQFVEGPPNDNEGSDGSLFASRIAGGIALYIKDDGTWFRIGGDIKSSQSAEIYDEDVIEGGGSAVLGSLSAAAGFAEVGGSHALLAGLTSDDHPNYVHSSKARTISVTHTMTGGLNIAGNISGTGTDAHTLWSDAGANTITIGGATTPVVCSEDLWVTGHLKLTGDSILDSSGSSTITMDGSQNSTFAGVTKHPAGAEALPSIVYSSDVDTGIWFPSVNKVAISTGGTEAFRLDGSQDATFAGDATIGEDATIGGKLTVTGNEIISSSATALTLSGADVAVSGILQVTGNYIKSSGGSIAIGLDGNSVSIIEDLTIGGNTIKSSGGTGAIELSSDDVSVLGDLTVTSNNIHSSSAQSLLLAGANVSVLGDLSVEGKDIGDGTATSLSLDGADVDVAGDLTVTGGNIWSSTAKAIELDGAAVNVIGDFTVDGSETTINSTVYVVADAHIEIGAVAVPTDITADGGGIILKGLTDKEILWANADDSWHFDQGIIVGADTVNHGMKLYGDTTLKSWDWGITGGDTMTINGDASIIGNYAITGNSVITGTVDIGVNSSGHDVNFWGNTTDSRMFWDEGTNSLQFINTATLISTNWTDSSGQNTGAFWTTGGAAIGKKLYVGTDLDVDGVAYLDAVDIDGTTQFNNAAYIGVEEDGEYLKAYGNAAGEHMQWNPAKSQLKISGNATWDSIDLENGGMKIDGDIELGSDGDIKHDSNTVSIVGDAKIALEAPIIDIADSTKVIEFKNEILDAVVFISDHETEPLRAITIRSKQTGDEPRCMVGLGDPHPGYQFWPNETLCLSSDSARFSSECTLETNQNNARQNKWIFKGRRADGTLTTTGSLSIAHAGTGNDNLSYISWFVNTEDGTDDDKLDSVLFMSGYGGKPHNHMPYGTRLQVGSIGTTYFEFPEAMIHISCHADFDDDYGVGGEIGDALLITNKNDDEDTGSHILIGGLDAEYTASIIGVTPDAGTDKETHLYLQARDGAGTGLTGIKIYPANIEIETDVGIRTDDAKTDLHIYSPVTETGATIRLSNLDDGLDSGKEIKESWNDTNECYDLWVEYGHGLTDNSFIISTGHIGDDPVGTKFAAYGYEDDYKIMFGESNPIFGVSDRDFNGTYAFIEVGSRMKLNLVQLNSSIIYDSYVGGIIFGGTDTDTDRVIEGAHIRCIASNSWVNSAGNYQQATRMEFCTQSNEADDDTLAEDRARMFIGEDGRVCISNSYTTAANGPSMFSVYTADITGDATEDASIFLAGGGRAGMHISADFNDVGTNDTAYCAFGKDHNAGAGGIGESPHGPSGYIGIQSESDGGLVTIGVKSAAGAIEERDYGKPGASNLGDDVIFLDVDGYVGINTGSSTKRLDILDAGGPQLCLTYDASHYSDIRTNQDGSAVWLNISPYHATKDKWVYYGADADNIGLGVSDLDTSLFAGSGWGIADDGNDSWQLYTDEIYCRGQMYMHELVINQIRATNGSLIVSSSAKASEITAV